MFSTISKAIFSTSSAASTAGTAQQQWTVHSKKCQQDWLEASSMIRNLKKTCHEWADLIILPPL